MQESKVVSINNNTCTGCGVCVSMCPQQILYIDKKTKKCAVTDENRCDRLAGCERACAANAITIVGKMSLLGMIMNKILKN